MDFDGRDDARFVALVGELSASTPHMVLIPCDSEGIRMANRVRGMLAINIVAIPDTPTLEQFEDGLRFHRFCSRNALAAPATRAVAADAVPDFDALAAQLGVPFVLKPARSGSRFGARIIHTGDQLAQAMAAAQPHEPLLAQRYIDGTDIAINLLADRGQLSAFAIEQASGAQIDFISHAELERIAARLCHVAAYHGAMRLTARIGKQTGNIYLIRSDPFFWSSLPAAVWCGLNFVAESLRQTPRLDGIPRLAAGLSFPRHPLSCPALWPRLVYDASERGRLLRAMMLTPRALKHAARALLSSARRQSGAQLPARNGRFTGQAA
jgi:hypothetical protein